MKEQQQIENFARCIEIKGTFYTLNFFEGERDYLGRTDLTNKEILICVSQDNLDIAKTIFHELMHAYFYECGLRDFADNEILVTFLGETFLDVIDNYDTVRENAKQYVKNIDKGGKR